MEDFVILDGDAVQFIPAFGQAIVTVRPAIMAATRFPPSTPGYFNVNGRQPCVAGDEQRVSVPGCAYIAPPFVVPGVGTLKIQQLGPMHLTQRARLAGRPLLLKGMQFTALFEVQVPAKNPAIPTSGPLPDPTMLYQGCGTFITSNTVKKLS